MGTLKVGDYELEKLLGEGGMGSVYEGKSATGRRVAIKLINADVAVHSNVLARFEIEAKAASAIDSPHVARVVDFGRAEGAPFLVMELLRGKDLETLFAELKVLPPELVARFGAQCCRGLAQAHARGIVHRDVKPANLMLAEAEAGEVVLKILDFGIAKVRADEWQALAEEPLTRTGSLLGSPRYMSPEQARGYKAIDQRSDLFSLAVVMYQGLTGHTPHHRVEAMGDLIVTLCSDPSPPVRRDAPWVDVELERVVMKALAIQAADRYASADEMARDLAALYPEAALIDGSLLVTFDPSSIADTQRTPPPLSSFTGAPSSAASTLVEPARIEPPRAEPSAASHAPTRTPPPMSNDQAKNKDSEGEGLDLDSIPLTWVGAGIALSLVIGIGGVATGVIPLPAAKDGAVASAEAASSAPPGSDAARATASSHAPAPPSTAPASSAASTPPTSGSSGTVAPPSAVPSGGPSVGPSALPSAAAPAASMAAKPALTGHMPVAPPKEPGDPYESSPPPAHPTPQPAQPPAPPPPAQPAPPTESPL